MSKNSIKLKLKRNNTTSSLVSYGSSILSPIMLNSELSKICQLVDDFYKKSYPTEHKDQKISNLIKGAFYAARPECRSNPDWMSQSANSAREVLYPLLRSSDHTNNLIKLFNKYTINQDNQIKDEDFVFTFLRLNDIYKKLTDITHHCVDPKSQMVVITDDDFINLLDDFSFTLKRAFNFQQLHIHTVIDLMVSQGIAKEKISDIFLILRTNDDAKRYFFSKISSKNLGFLWKKGFLDSIKKKVLNPDVSDLITPELNYLFSVAEDKSDVVTSFINSINLSTSSLDFEVLDQFKKICSNLPAKCIKRLVNKIKNEKWVELASKYKYAQYGFEYEEMFKKLYEVNDYESILILAQAVLITRSKKEINERSKSYKTKDIFYIHDLFETKVFTYLAEIPDQYLEQTLSILIEPFLKSIDYRDNYLLMDEDLFVLKLTEINGRGYREEFKFLVSTILEIMRRIGVSSNFDIRKIYEKYFYNKSKNRLFKRLNLFVLSLNPKIFIKELEIEFFQLFEVKNKLDVLYGAEYEQSLKVGFSFLNNANKREFVKKIFDFFTFPKNDNERRWNRHYASCILSTISENLTDNEVNLAEKNEFKIDPKYKPEPSIGKVTGGTVNPKSPINEEDFAKLKVEDIVSKLKSELSPNELQEKYKNDNFLNPRNAEGVAQQLENDIKLRINDYLAQATLFFDRDKLNPHYTETYLSAVKKTLSENRNSLNNLNFDNLFELLIRIKDSGNKETFDNTRENPGSVWLSDWISVHLSISALLEELMKEKDKKVLLDFDKYRNKIFDLITYLFKFNNPVTEDEKLETAKSKVKYTSDSEYLISDPFTGAINSVRGSTFETLVYFVYLDSKDKDSKKSKLSDDVKELYECVLNAEKTRAIMFMFGRYLYYFYFRDIDWMKSLWKEIFESDSKDKYLHLAAWEGYVSNNLYNEVFSEPYIQKLYSIGINSKLEYPKQKFFKDPSEALSIHLALAFVNFKQFDLNHPLFKEFLEKADTKQLSEFISFIGGSYISNDNSSVLKGSENQWKVEKLKDFWNLVIKTKNDSESLKEFGHWVNVDKGIWNINWLASEISQTLKITDGLLEWSYGLLESIEKLATESPKNTLEILELYIYSTIEKQNDYLFFREDKQWYNAFKILYKNKDDEIKNKTYELINKLIRDGGQRFWILEDIVKEND